MSEKDDISRLAKIKDEINSVPTQEGSEYWALIFAVGVYLNNPDQDRPSMLEAADDLYNELLDSDHWQADHIKVIKGQAATGQNLIQGLIWLDDMEDSDDVCLIYITTHGFPLRNSNGLPLDIPPKDEPDGADEALVMYEGFQNWYSFIWDDMLNFFVSLLESEGVCLIVDSCYSGGFNDSPFEDYGGPLQGYSAKSFTDGLIDDLKVQGRVVLMSTSENKLSYGSYFSNYLIEGFQGWADVFGNADGIVSAEEAFEYAQFWVNILMGDDQDPTMRDLYSGELSITDSFA